MDGRVILAVDEGTTGTRAALVSEAGEVSGLAYRRLGVDSPHPGVVEQDADEIWERTLDVCRAAVAAGGGAAPAAVAVTTQRATSVLWDTRTGRSLVPAMVWQDTRYAGELADYAGVWDARLVAQTGRPVGVRSPYLWAARHIEGTPEVREAYRTGALRFGTIDTWLLWNLTGGAVYAVTPTNVCSSGAYTLAEHAYQRDWIDALGFPGELLPELREDGDELGTVLPGLLGNGVDGVPVLAVLGDQHAATIGLGCLDAGQAMCVHGTGSFVDVVAGTEVPPNTGEVAGALTLIGWRTGGRSVYTVESFSSTTGSALDWMCNTFAGFSSARDVSELAASVPDAGGTVFLPTLAGLRTPVTEPRLGAGLSGMTMSTTRAHVAHAVLEGIAHAVADSAAGVSRVVAAPITSMQVGGGLSASAPLMRMQADLIGVPMARVRDADTASLRGAAYLAGSRGLFWETLAEAASTRGSEDVFEPAISSDERSERRAAWNRRIRAELELLDRSQIGR
ncbi:glycerol kinase [Spinactinospora alkalitolerans]|uniref:ATP:glycerol 3-phosphotransferase n=1 Tax=Spinactinospora alkalitolerans TaxID=687207 RepID=A0A852TVJ7_9ACTN|nr:FGGY family carbohydrate kinase [Spinactinospora alkalitolerans]NYE47958.1 glycerol kinase [Spinactinospora alkalitolerans]